MLQQKHWCSCLSSRKQEFLDLEKIMAAWDAENPVITPNQVVEPVLAEAKVVEPVVGPVVETTVPKPVPPQEPTALQRKNQLTSNQCLGGWSEIIITVDPKTH